MSGLTGTGLVLQDNGGDNLSVTANGAFTFATKLNSGSAYSVTVMTQPSGQTCTVANASGTASANVTNVAVTCTSSGTTVTIGGTVTGLTGTGLVLQDNGGDNLSVTANGAFTFTTALAAKTAYAVTVLTQPSGQTCTVTNGTGTTGTTNVTNVAVNCAAVAVVGKFAYTTSYTNGMIYSFTINASTGALTQIGTTVADGVNPAAVSLAPNGKFAFSASSNGTKVQAFTIDQSTGALTLVGSYSTGFSAGSTYPDIAVSPNSEYLYLASSGDAEIAGFAIDQTTGALAATPSSPYPAGAGAGGIPAFSPNGNFVYVVNETANTVSGWAVDSGTGHLTSVGTAVAAGTDPTWISFTPSGNFAYVSDTNGKTISLFSVSTTSGVLTALSPATVPTAESPADLTIDSSGTHLYVPMGTGSADGGVQVYTIGSTGTLTAAGILNQVGIGPRFVDIDPTHAFAYVSSAGTGGTGVYGFSISSTTGELTPLNGGVAFPTGSQPDFITIDPSGKFGYTDNQLSGTITEFAINPTTGALTVVGTATVGANPLFVSISPEASNIRD